MLDDTITSATVPTVEAVPTPFALPPGQVALMVIDMQRDFVEPGGFGETLGNDVSLLQRVIPRCREVLAATRAAGMTVIHTREGHLTGPVRLPARQAQPRRPSLRIGDPGPNGRILVRGEYGHDIIDELARRGRAGDRQAGQGRVLRHRPARDPGGPRHHQPDRHRRHHRGVRAHHRPRGQRPRLRGAWCCPTASAPTSPSSSGPAWP